MCIVLHYSNILLCWLFILLLLLQPGLAHEGADTGIKIFIDHLFPYLLPYLILTQWLLRLTNVSSIPQHTKWKFYLQVYFLSALGGFPTGAATINFLLKSQQITKREAPLLLAICHAPSPLFVVGFVGVEILKNPTSGWYMLSLIHFVNIVMLFIFMLKFRKTNTKPIVTHQSEVLSTSPLIESIKNSLPTVLLVAATVIFFTTISFVMTETILRFVHQLPDIVMLALYSVLEMTSGLAVSQNLFAHSKWLELIVITILTLQGLSIHLQVAVLAKEAKISMVPYAYTRIFQTFLIPLLYWLIFLPHR
ncbi:hypothetical protein [Rummeliibacillus sp. SL167]|uniref:hypothetical protein n=1 Tax=Rummeliibacillus sp. SL167 TaxID=2579792 RepID=UPI0011B676B5|nr:hypothetical protein [Rummeliibacillus sp. SL167]